MKLSEKIFHKIDGRKIQLVFHVSSGVLQAALVYFQDNEKPNILYSAQEALPFTSEFSHDVFFKNSQKAFTTLCNTLVKNMGGMYELDDLLESHRRISDVTLFFTTPWVQKSAHLIKHQEEETFVVDEELLISLMNIEEQQNSYLLDNAMHSVKLNGYPVNVNEALNKPAESLELGFLKTTINETTYEWFTNELERIFNIPATHIQAYPFSSVAQYATHSLFKPDSNYTLLHMHANSTDLVVVKDSTLSGYWNLTYGRNDVLREIIKNTKATTKALAYSLLSSSLKNSLEKTIQEEVEEILNIESQTLSSLIGSGVTGMGVVGSLTGKVYIYTHDDTREFTVKHPLEVFGKTTSLYVGKREAADLCNAMRPEYLHTALVLDIVFINEHAERYAHINT